MKKNLLLIVLLLLIDLTVESQISLNWSNIVSNDPYGMGEQANDNVIDKYGNVYVCGYTGIQTPDGTMFDYDAFVQKISPEGETLWFLMFGSDELSDNTAYDTFFEIIVDNENECVYVGGQSSEIDNSHYPFLVKLDFSGNVLARQIYYRFGSGAIWTMKLSDDFIVISGYCGANDNNFFAEVRDFDLNSEAFLIGDYIYGYDFTIDNEGYIYQTVADSNYYHLIKYSPDGYEIWNNGECRASIVVNSGNKIYTLGTSTVCQMNYTGEIIWKSYVTGYSKNFSNNLLIDSVGNVYVAVYKYTDTTKRVYEAKIVKFSSSGELLWEKYFDKTYIKEIAFDEEENLYYTGTFYNDIDEIYYPQDILVGKINTATGETVWERTWDQAKSYDVVKCLTVAGIDNILVSGTTHNFDTWLDILTLNFKNNLQDNNTEQICSLRLFNYPNPVDNKTIINFYLKQYIGYGKIVFYNLNGIVVDKIVISDLSKGAHSILWERKDLPAGIYYYQLIGENKLLATNKMIIN